MDGAVHTAIEGMRPTSVFVIADAYVPGGHSPRVLSWRPGMGAIFRRHVMMEPLTTAMAGTITTHIHSAMAAPLPDQAELIQEQVSERAREAAEDAAQVAEQPPTRVSIKWQALLIALGLFFVLLVIAIVLDWKDMVDDPKVYTGMVTTVLGAVLGFLTGDAMGTASSE
jgi:hypothetical protein